MMTESADVPNMDDLQAPVPQKLDGNHSESISPPVSFTDAVASMVENGSDQFDPMRFRYIESMTKKAQSQSEQVSCAIEKKVLAAIVAYQEDYTREREQTRIIVGEIASLSPEISQRVNHLFEVNKFKEVRQLKRRLDRINIDGKLAALTESIAQRRVCFEEDIERGALDELLRQQEYDLTQSIGNLGEGEASALGSHFDESRSFRLFRDALAKSNSNKLVTQAVNEGPENPGPLNPQMLAIRSLSTMRNLSPEYLNRYVSYMETLLWLEEVGVNIELAASKKGKAK